MSTVPVAARAGMSPAHAWFDEHYPQLLSRAQVFVRRLCAGQRDDAVAEILAQIWRYTLSAATRGKLQLLTPFTLVSFFGRAYINGRRLSGGNTTDVLAPAAQRKRGLRVISLHETRLVRTPEGLARLPLHEVLADRRADQPAENCRRDCDYPEILRRQQVSRQARRVFRWLAESHGTARGIDLARRLRVSPPRIVQIKERLAECLGREGYAPNGWRPGRRRSRRGRPRRYIPPLNAGTSPPMASSWRAGRRSKRSRIAVRGIRRGHSKVRM